MRLTIKSADDLKLPVGKKDHIVFDDDITGFGIRLREGGSRTWIYQYRYRRSGNTQGHQETPDIEGL